MPARSAQHLLRKGRVKGYSHADDMARIVGLPIDMGISSAEVEEMSRLAVTPEWYAKGYRLKEVQAWALLSLLETEGLFGPVRVGEGKTLISLKGCADMYYRKGHERVMLSVPANVSIQLIEHDIEFYRQRVRLFGMPFHILAGRSPEERLEIANSGARGCYVFTYSLLSRQHAEDILYAINPTFWMCDEVHELKNDTAARTKRATKFWTKKDPPKVAGISGTVSDKSIREYKHIIRACMKDRAPIPRSNQDVDDWAEVVDASASGRPPHGIVDRIRPIRTWADANQQALHLTDQDLVGDTRSYRKVYQARLHSAPGVVVNQNDNSIGTSLVVANEAAAPTEGWDRLQELLHKVEKGGETPNGDPIAHAMLAYKWCRELSAGFYNELYWPDLGWIEARRGTSKLSASDILLLSQAYHQAHCEYNSLLGKWLRRRSIKNLDTPMLVASNMARYGRKNVGATLYGGWTAMNELDFDGRIDRLKRTVRVCDYKVQQAVRISESDAWDGHGLIWYYHQEVGRWLYEAMPDAVFCPAGKASNRKLKDINAVGGRTVILSISAHNQGKNLQEMEHHHNWVVEWPREAKVAEQMIGRTHRAGQRSDQMVVGSCITTAFDEEVMAACLNDTCYQQQTLPGQRLKMMFATFVPPPRVIPSAVLHERGFHDIRKLNEHAQQELDALFTQAA